MADYDVVIVGSGLAGLTAGLFAARYGLSTLVLEANIPGGHLTSIEKIEDFPGFPEGIAGYDLCPTVQRQAAAGSTFFALTEPAIRLAASGAIDLEGFITATYPFERVAAAMADYERDPDRVLLTVIIGEG